ncbi:hypothetical protein [Candidatus Contubernalis alkaliaceticus]|uniref:hypothetical protein n=1 Tax=Candidatus Contubernalis alkaliaceticus TaxID=338645 RepID=UPI001F4BFBA8|nr:hypothetical protein [Candidatus Contubernalis alkalaceticus]UNC92087.1 DUF3784 domain-containing protein [Candidatus Contubernalis alkalaceticus]
MIVVAIIGFVCLVYSIFAFQQKGPLLTTMYFLVNPEERKKMKTKTEYLFVATVYLGIAIMFFSILIGELFNLSWMPKVTIIFAIFLVIYVIVASIWSEMAKKK